MGTCFMQGTAMYKIYGESLPGNGYKIELILAFLEIDHD
jgi:hypothetical protein